MGREFLYQFYGQVASIIVSQLRFKAAMISLAMVAVLPAYFALVFGLSREELGVVLTGAIVSPAVWINSAMIQDILYERENYRYLEMLIASPLRPVIYVLSRIAASIILSVSTVIPFTIIYVYVTGAYTAVPLALALTLLVSIFLAPISILSGLKLKSIKEASSMPTLLGALLVFLPPVYYTPWLLPEWLRLPATAIPSATAAEIVRATSINGYHPVIDPKAMITYLLALSTASLLLLYYRFNWSLE